MDSAPSRLLAAVLALAIAGCGGGGPRPAQSKSRAKHTTVLATEADDRRAGEESTRDIIGEFGLLSNSVLQAYVQAVGERVARHAAGGFTYRFQVIQPWIPNALALPGGAIFVSRGIVALASSEDELAGVLAHEVTHVARRHASAQQQIISMTPFAFGIYGYAQIAAYARDQEREADRGGQQLLAAAGYDPRAMASMLRKLDQVDRLQLGAPQLPSFLTTHPSPTERTATAYALAQQLAWTRQPGIARDDEDFLHRLEGLVAGADPSEGVFVGNRFLHPDLDFGVSFPEGWTLVNSPTMVAAYPPERAARFALESAGPGDDPKVAAGRFLAVEAPENHTQIVDARSIEIEGRPAFEVRAWGPTPQGAMAGQLTWIAYNGSVYRFSAAAPGAYAELFFGRARIMSRSFRPLTPAERESIRVERIAIARARGGESIETLSKRAGNAWDATETAIWNGLIPDAQLEAGEPVKISHSEIYLTAKEAPPGGAGAAAAAQPAGQPSR